MSAAFDRSRRRFLQASATLGAIALARPVFAAATTQSGTSAVAAAKAGLARVGGRIAHQDVVGVADFRLPSSQPRLHLVDLANGRIESLLVAHGRGSDPAHTGWLSRFSNAPGSDCTSEGAFLTAGYYVGEHGRSMRLAGLDASNSNAESRGIVAHSAWYVGPDMVRSHGMLGRSEGCFAVSPDDLDMLLARLGPGRLLLSTRL